MTNKETTSTHTPFITVQQLRLVDVFVVAPFCLYVATRPGLTRPVRIGMAALGIATLLYNGANYLKNTR